ncbi:hypothetical protein ACTXT7_000268 [Hymenolepis weldensis]
MSALRESNLIVNISSRQTQPVGLAIPRFLIAFKAVKVRVLCLYDAGPLPKSLIPHARLEPTVLEIRPRLVFCLTQDHKCLPRQDIMTHLAYHARLLPCE